MINTLSPSIRTGPKSAIFVKDYILKPRTSYFLYITFNNNDTEYPYVAECPLEGVKGWMNMGLTTYPYIPINMCLSSVIPPREFKFNDKIYKETIKHLFTINTKSTIIHEFCHALGMKHEHQNDIYSDGIIYENILAPVISDFSSSNFDKLNCKDGIDNCEYIGSKYDPYSLMHYKLGLFDNNNTYLSPIDKEWLTKMYPIKDDSNDYPKINIVFVDKPQISISKKRYVEAVITETFLGLVGVNYDIYHFDKNAIPYLEAQYIAKTTNNEPRVIIDDITKDYKPMNNYDNPSMTIIVILNVLILMLVLIFFFIISVHYKVQ